MVNIVIDESISSKLSTFKIGVVQYNNIVIGDSPQMLKGRLQFFQETLKVDLEEKELTEFEGIAEWRQAFKSLQMNPGRYRPSHEALFRRIKKGQPLPLVHSAVDLNTFFSLEYVIPLGIYDLDHIEGDVTFRLGLENEAYEGVNGRENDMSGKLVSADQQGAFGSPIVDSVRTKVTPDTTSALQFFYLKPSMNVTEASKLLQAAGKMFTQIHGGDDQHKVVTFE
ncbi:phenylalanine--tRNA ligase beta subunit-related protein [Alkalihalobacillus sp. MEB130]|uniref:B3/B4 domain-containing protein n=1 Tax=Alkalihalobacillus sp. MEB130 TaxID=2976704 RepID=UPI0028E034D2|nr:phenylalanine--tRNA ligase beta subunit-related protein [Alkalihalobacillus sp. MEB130]MDT8862370.1 phenylalanine--tRNA ligase beta subunit-related protein [Alkalihalobacillus sp. MEB130]